MFEWDFVKLNKTIDSTALLEWYTSVEATYSKSKFNFLTCSNYIKQSVNEKFTTNKEGYEFIKTRNSLQGLSSYTLTWPIESEMPLPPPWAADLNQFPELLKYFDNQGNITKDIDYLSHGYLSQYLFGEWKNIVGWLGEYIYNPRITIHSPDYEMIPHTDDYIARLHIPITQDSSTFSWGKNWDRKYKLEPGNIYIINTKIPHGTQNFGNTPRANIMADIVPEKLERLLLL